MSYRRRIIWVDDDQSYLKRVKFLLNREGIKVFCFSSVEMFYDELLIDSSILSSIDAIIFDYLFQDSCSNEFDSNSTDCDISYELRHQFNFKGPLILCSQYSFDESQTDI